jgi:hypothetical protein
MRLQMSGVKGFIGAQLLIDVQVAYANRLRLRIEGREQVGAQAHMYAPAGASVVRSSVRLCAIAFGRRAGVQV